MPRTISDEEYNYLQRMRFSGEAAEDLWNDPALSNEAKALFKKKHPQTPIHDYDLRQELLGEINRDRSEREERERAKREKERDAEVKRLRDECQKKYGATDESMKELEDFMRKEYIGNYDVAAAYKFAKNAEMSEPTYNDNLWNHQKKSDFAEIAKDPEGWARTELINAYRKDQNRERQGY